MIPIPKNGRLSIGHGFANAQYNFNFQANSNLDILDTIKQTVQKNEDIAIKILISKTESYQGQTTAQPKTQTSK